MKPIHLLRYGLPAAICVVGVVLLCIGGTDGSAAGGSAFVIAAIVFGVNIFARMTIVSQRDRDREERARENYARTGRWEDAPAGGAAAATGVAGVAGPAGLPLARRVPPPVPAPDPHDPGHLSRPSTGGSRRGLEQRPRRRRPD